ncbi:hypothetical protein ABZ832_28765 [Streptantibioticus parmotrematis]|uniref:hypothetical protein n=1 Tax=Streptantibioticus parmotrematis TaxID=2873249 RepID=UPI0034114510
MADAAGEAALIGRSYTKARRRASVIGQWPGGGAIPFGPFTVTQFAVMGASFGALVMVAWYWAPFGPVPDVVLTVAVPPALGYAVRTVHVDGRNPLAVAAGVVLLLSAPADGRLGGRPLKQTRPRRAVGVCTLAGDEPAPPEALAAGETEASARTPLPEGSRARPSAAVSGAQALLAQRRAQLAGHQATLDRGK